MIRRTLLVAVIAVSLVAILPHPPAHARASERALAGKVALTARKLPGKKGERSYLRALRKQARGRAVFREDPRTGTWTIHYAAVSARPVRDVTIKIFDVSRGRRFVGTREKMLYAESSIVSGKLTLSRDEVFAPNARLRMVVEAPDGRVLAQRTFYIQGRAATYSGRVDFAAEDTAGAADDAITVESVRARRRRN